MAAQPKRFDYGRKAGLVERLRLDAEAHRCDKPATYEYEKTLLSLGNPRAVVDDAAAYFQACDDWFRVRQLSHDAHLQLRDYAGAAEDATRLITAEPHEWRHYQARATDYRHLGRRELVAADLRQAMVLQPSVRAITEELAYTAEKLAQPCDAIVPLEAQVYYDHYVARPRLAAQLASCPQKAGTGSARIIDRDDPHVLDGRVLVGGVRARFSVAADSAYVVITRALAQRLHLDLSAAPSLLVDVSDDHFLPARLVRLPSLQLDDARAEEIEAAVVDALPGGLDGRLGISFFGRFETSLSSTTGGDVGDVDGDDGALVLRAP